MNAIQLNSRGGPDALAYAPAVVPRPGVGGDPSVRPRGGGTNRSRCIDHRHRICPGRFRRICSRRQP